MKDLRKILPYMDENLVISVSGMIIPNSIDIIEI